MKKQEWKVVSIEERKRNPQCKVKIDPMHDVMVEVDVLEPSLEGNVVVERISKKVCKASEAVDDLKVHELNIANLMATGSLGGLEHVSLKSVNLDGNIDNIAKSLDQVLLQQEQDNDNKNIEE